MNGVALNGCNEEVHLFGKKIYYNWDNQVLDIETLGEELDKVEFIQSRIKEEFKNDKDKLYETLSSLDDFQLYDNAWIVLTSNNPELFRYLCQITYKKPNMLNYFDRYWK